MKNILLDIDSIAYFIHLSKNGWEQTAYLTMLQKGIRSLQNQKVIVVTKNKKRVDQLFRKLHIDKIEIWEERKSKNISLINVFLELSCSKKETLLVSTSPNLLEQAALLEIPSVYLKAFSNGDSPINATYEKNKLEEISLLFENQQNSIPVASPSIYINPQLISFFQKQFSTSYSTNLLDFPNGNPEYAYTQDPYQAFQLQRRGVTVCFINMHHNDFLDIQIDFEMSVETFTKKWYNENNRKESC